MTPSQLIRQWCAAQGYAYKYGNPTHINVWMGETDFSASTDGVCVFAHLLTASDYDPSGHDRHNLAIYFATLTPFDFDTDTIDQVTEGLHARAKSLLAYIQQGNAFGWEGARFQYGYDDYAENVAWCCLRVTLTALSADCVEQPQPPQPSQSYEMVDGLLPEFLEAVGISGTQICALASTIDHDNYIGIAWLSRMEMDNPSAMVNGEEADTGNAELADENLVEYVPSLAPYIGWYLYSGSYYYEGIISEGEPVSVAVYEGDVKVLECGGVMPHVEEDNGGDLRGTKKGGFEWPKLKR